MRARFLVPASLALALTAARAAAADAAPLSRCTAPDGAVTYTNASCPVGSRAAAVLVPLPAPSAADQAAARQRAQHDAAAVRTADAAAARAQADARRSADRATATATRDRERCARATLAVQRAQQRYDQLRARPMVPATEARADGQLLKAQQAQALACRAPP